MNYVVGQRYPLTLELILAIAHHASPAFGGEIDLSRGWRFLGTPCQWEFWTTDGRKVQIEHAPGKGYVCSQSPEPDPERPEPLEGA